MKNKLTLLSLFAAFLLCCTEQESDIGNETERFFNTSGAEHRLSLIADRLKQSKDTTTYRILTRQIMTRTINDRVEQNWMFDYFTIYALQKKPASGLSIVPELPLASTRSISGTITEHCNHIISYAGEYETDQGYYCWYEVDIYCIAENFDVFKPGGGGSSAFGNGYMENDYYGGGGGNNSAKQNEDRSPCNAANQLSNDAAFKAKANSLFNATKNYRTGDTENGWIKTTTKQYISPSERTAKSMKYPDLTGKKITEEYHSHPTGSCIPSFADLKVLATRYKKGQIDVANFSYGVISSMGCFTMVITSEEAFKGFAEKILYDPKIKIAYNKMHEIENTNGVDTAIAKFIAF